MSQEGLAAYEKREHTIGFCRAKKNQVSGAASDKVYMHVRMCMFMIMSMSIDMRRNHFVGTIGPM